MPIFEFKCPVCGDLSEIVVLFGDKPKVRCPRCESIAKKVLSRPGVVKVNGFNDKNHYGLKE